jgi:uncharacterized protein YqfB (UPF0267 family)
MALTFEDKVKDLGKKKLAIQKLSQSESRANSPEQLQYMRDLKERLLANIKGEHLLRDKAREVVEENKKAKRVSPERLQEIVDEVFPD